MASAAHDAAQLYKTASRHDLQENSEHRKKEVRTAADVFADRAPSVIDMDLLWKLQADHYKEFASRLHDGDADNPQATVQNAPDQLYGGQDALNLGARSGEQARVGRELNGGTGGSISTFGKEEGTERAGPSRKSVRRAKKRMLESGLLSRELPADPGSCEPSLGESLGAAGDSVRSKIERRRDAELEPSPKSIQKQAEGPGPPQKQGGVKLVASETRRNAPAEVAQNQRRREEVSGEGEGPGVAKSPGQPSKVLYVKNLDRSVIKGDLLALFLPFQRTGAPSVSIRLMQRGRMKGQAFITFPDLPTAREALEATNGLVIIGRPLIVEFGRNPG
ncbi:RNA recognition motif containing protein [Klebsormidium nitens]|uniref:RNA recognition motif containing protein n=1 Tax=Klebsormidium nitens TaxID=105231 RepID=A0A1Y1IAY2_KLENI|nr:RNA recognition motif containing protein [Klebsormidium nitens]|eukprot:GAQ88125.1 RNA recognition motif containing protein [Klebsormidium nitens]